MLSQLLPALRATIVLAILTGLIFPFVVTVIAQICFPKQAAGSLIRNNSGQVLGSELIGQTFAKPEYFHPRPSAAGSGYAGEASGGTNLGPTSKKLINGIEGSFSGIKQLAEDYRKENFLSDDAGVPVDAVTRSASGLDAHISVANAKVQAERVSKARNLPLQQVLSLVSQFTEQRQYGFLGEPRVNVLMLNIALDKQAKISSR